MATTAQEYKEKAQQTREVTLPSGAVFKIKNITGRDFVRDGGIPLDTLNQLTSSTADEKKDILMKKLSAEDRKKLFDYNDTLITRACVEPRVTLNGEPGTIAITDIVDADYYFLLNEIVAQKGGGDAVKSFREGESDIDSGSNREAIQ